MGKQSIAPRAAEADDLQQAHAAATAADALPNLPAFQQRFGATVVRLKLNGREVPVPPGLAHAQGTNHPKGESNGS